MARRVLPLRLRLVRYAIGLTGSQPYCRFWMRINDNMAATRGARVKSCCDAALEVVVAMSVLTIANKERWDWLVRELANGQSGLGLPTRIRPLFYGRPSRCAFKSRSRAY